MTKWQIERWYYRIKYEISDEPAHSLKFVLIPLKRKPFLSDYFICGIDIITHSMESFYRELFLEFDWNESYQKILYFISFHFPFIFAVSQTHCSNKYAVLICNRNWTKSFRSIEHFSNELQLTNDCAPSTACVFPCCLTHLTAVEKHDDMYETVIRKKDSARALACERESSSFIYLSSLGLIV